jgi:hypothetical protein
MSSTPDGIVTVFPSAEPDFIRVRYTLQSAPYRPFADMRHFWIELILTISDKDKPNLVWLARREVDYNICAVVRLVDDRLEQPDDIRTYWKDGHEIVPSEVGIIRPKDGAAMHTRWTVQSQGTFDLYYYRLSRPAGWTDRGSGIDETAPEFEERAWVKEMAERESNVTPASSAVQQSSHMPASSATSMDLPLTQDSALNSHIEEPQQS